MEEQRKLAEEESLLRQSKLVAEKARLLKQQSIRRESLEKKNEVILQISERGSVVESATSSREKVASWLTANMPNGKSDRNTLGNHGNLQYDSVPAAPHSVASLIINVPSRVTEIPSELPPALQVAETHNSSPRQRFPGPTGIPHVSGRVGYHEVRSTTIREPFQQFVTSSRPLQTNPLPVHPYPPSIHSSRGHSDGGEHTPQIFRRQEPSWTTPGLCDAIHDPPLTRRSVEPNLFSHESRPEQFRHLGGPTVNTAMRANNHEPIGQAGVLSTQQIAARQVVGKDLPHFGGNPADWPMFISSFEQSTVACGYSNAENLARLQRCLTGHAREAVRSRLLLPANVPQVMNTLRTLYGRPELLIRSLHEKIRRTPGPRHDRIWIGGAKFRRPSSGG